MTLFGTHEVVNAEPIPLTVIGGYLGAGKTTLVNHLLRHPAGRRIGVIVNDFGTIGLDAELLAGSTVDGDVISLANGCACCTVGAGLHEALIALTERAEPLDHVVIEVSGVADPAVAAGWGTVPPFEPGGVIVLVAADAVMRLANDRYVGGEVRRQLVGADLLVVTKSDLCTPDELAALDSWLEEQTTPVQRLTVERGEVPTDVILGVRSAMRLDGSPPDHDHGSSEHEALYEHRSWTTDVEVPEDGLRRFVDDLPAGVLRAKGVVRVVGGGAVSVQVVGRRTEIRDVESVGARSSLVVIARQGTLGDIDDPFGLVADGQFRSSG